MESTEKKKTGPFKWLNENSFISGIIGNILIIFLLTGLGFIKVIPKIRETHSTVIQIKSEIDDLKRNYLTKDLNGIEVIVGVSAKVEGNNVTVFKDNAIGLKYDDVFYIYNDINEFKPSAKLLVSNEIEKDGDISKAEIFISKKAAEILGFKDISKQGIFKVRIKRVKITEEKIESPQL